MLTLPRLLCAAAMSLAVTLAQAADAPKDAALTQVGSAPASSVQLDNLEFAGVSTVGSKTIINLFEKQAKKNLWIEAGTTSGGITVGNYDSAHDQVTVKVNGTEKLLPLRAPSAVVNGTTPTVPIPQQPVASAATPAAPTSTGSTTQLSQARQEEEARMLVSDLLEIGMAQRKAYEEAQKKAAGGQSQTAQPDGQTPAAAAPQAATPAQPVPAGQATPAAPTATPSS